MPSDLKDEICCQGPVSNMRNEIFLIEKAYLRIKKLLATLNKDLWVFLCLLHH